MAENNAVVSVYDPHAVTNLAIKELQSLGFDMSKLSIVGKDYHSEERIIADDNAGDRMKVWGEIASFWGGLPGLLLGSAFYFIPGIGPVIVFGPLVSWIVRALEGTVMVGGLSALGAGLHGVGIPQISIMEYEKALVSDKFIVIAHGKPDDITQNQEYSRNARRGANYIHH